MILSRLICSFTVYWKNKFLKSLVVALKFGKGEKCVVGYSNGLGMKSFKYWGKPLDYIF